LSRRIAGYAEHQELLLYASGSARARDRHHHGLGLRLVRPTSARQVGLASGIGGHANRVDLIERVAQCSGIGVDK
jgi:hypothetical protein